MADLNPIAGGATAAAAFLQWLAGQSANSTAVNTGLASLNQAQGAIQGAADKSIALQQPYTQNAGADYSRLRGLVQSGYFQTPYGQSFNPQQNRPNGFTMNPSQGMASFNPQSFQTNSYTPQGLPPMPNLPAYQAPPPQAQPQAPQTPVFQPSSIADITKIISQARQPTQPLNPSSATPSPVYNPQTGQNNPLGTQFKPADPRMPTIQDLILLLNKYPVGGSGPYGMTGGLMGGGMR